MIGQKSGNDQALLTLAERKTRQPSPDYMDVIILLRKVPKGAMIQATENGLVWYL